MAIQDITSQLLLTNELLEAYKTQNLKEIQAAHEKVQQDLEPLRYKRPNVPASPKFVEVESKGERFHASWSDKATVWAHARPHSSVQSMGKQAFRIQFGIYSQQAALAWVHNFTWTDWPSGTVPSSLSLKVARVLERNLKGEIIKKNEDPDLPQDLRVVVARAFVDISFQMMFSGFGARLSEKLRAGTRDTSGLLEYGFGGLTLLLTQKYGLLVQLLNYDTTDWKTLEPYLPNTVIKGEGKSFTSVTIPGFMPAEKAVSIPGFKPAQAMKAAVGYTLYAFENDSTFTGGLGVAMSLEPVNSPSTGLSFKYDVGRLKDNRLALADRATSLKNFYEQGNWVKEKVVTHQVLGKTITGSTPELSNVADSVYRFTVFIDRKKD